MSTYSTYAASGGADGPAGGGGSTVCGTTAYVICSDSNRALGICLTCECPSGNICLPNATTLSPGSPTYIIKNENQNTTYLLRDNTTCVLTSVAPGQAVDVSLYDNSTAAGEWVVGKFSKPTAFNPLSDQEVQSPLLGSTFCTWSDGNSGGHTLVSYDHGSCCVRAATFKTCNGEKVKVGEVGVTVPKCDFDVCGAHNGVVIWSCLYCSCGSCLVDYAKFITAINCDSTCAVTWISCCDVNYCHDTGSTKLGRWNPLGCVEGTSKLVSAGLLNCASRCAYINIACINTTTTGAPTCTLAYNCLNQGLASCTPWCQTREHIFIECDTLCYDRPKCCVSGVQAYTFASSGCTCGEAVSIIYLKNSMCVCWHMNTANNCNPYSFGGGSVYGHSHFICDQPLLGRCFGNPACVFDQVKLNHCSCCTCHPVVHQRSAGGYCGFIPIAQNWYLCTYCCWSFGGLFNIRCFCANCLVVNEVSTGSDYLNCFNFQTFGCCCASTCLFTGRPCINQQGQHAWNQCNRNDGTRKLISCSIRANIEGGVEACASHWKNCFSGQPHRPFGGDYDNVFFFTCCTIDCLAGYMISRNGSTACELKWDKFYVNTSVFCKQCSFCTMVPPACQTDSYQCYCFEEQHQKYWDPTTCRLCVFRPYRGDASLFCLTGACNCFIVCSMCSNTSAGSGFPACNLNYNGFAHSTTNIINISFKYPGTCPMTIGLYKLDTFPGCIFCCAISGSDAGRPWCGGYSSTQCRLFLASGQYICSSNVYTNTGLILGEYNPTGNCFDNLISGVSEAVPAQILGTDPRVSALTTCFTNRMVSYIKGKD